MGEVGGVSSDGRDAAGVGERRQDGAGVDWGSGACVAKLWALALGDLGGVSSDARDAAGVGSYDKTCVGLGEQGVRGDTRGHSHWVTSVAFHPTHGTWLASGSGDYTVRVWDWGRGRAATRRGHSRLVRSAAFHRRTGRGWRRGVGTIRCGCGTGGKACVATLRGHSRLVMSVAFSPAAGVGE